MTQPLRAPLADVDVARAHALVEPVATRLASRIVGQEGLRTALLVALLSRGHLLLESAPGLAKTLAAATLAGAVDGTFARIQCTPDLLPSDIVGSQVFDARSATFATQLGPVHANVVLLDEINRSSAKTQSAMLEAMQERQTTIGGVAHPLPEVFLVLATQNPLEEEGTYVLPHAQLDRFALKEVLTHPSPAQELAILDRLDAGVLDDDAPAAPVATLADVVALQELTARVHASDAVRRYLVDIVDATRHADRLLGAERGAWVEHGASPRASIAFLQASRARALLDGRGHVLPEDVKALRHQVLRHRVVLSFEAQAEGVAPETVIDELVAHVVTP